jgi:hypothetical protein
MSTMRRDVLKRLVEAGRVELIGSYHYDDGYGASEHKGAALPVAIMPADRHACREGICYLYPSDLTSSSGSATRGLDGNISLYVHSNCSYALHIKEDRAPVIVGEVIEPDDLKDL